MYIISPNVPINYKKRHGPTLSCPKYFNHCQVNMADTVPPEASDLHPPHRINYYLTIANQAKYHQIP